jgi:hypothetical protein
MYGQSNIEARAHTRARDDRPNRCSRVVSLSSRHVLHATHDDKTPGRSCPACPPTRLHGGDVVQSHPASPQPHTAASAFAFIEEPSSVLPRTKPASWSCVRRVAGVAAVTPVSRSSKEVTGTSADDATGGFPRPPQRPARLVGRDDVQCILIGRPAWGAPDRLAPVAERATDGTPVVQHLRNRQSPLLKRPSPRFPEVRFVDPHTVQRLKRVGLSPRRPGSIDERVTITEPPAGRSKPASPRRTLVSRLAGGAGRR